MQQLNIILYNTGIVWDIVQVIQCHISVHVATDKSSIYMTLVSLVPRPFKGPGYEATGGGADDASHYDHGCYNYG